jgi:prophage regulatory protein
MSCAIETQIINGKLEACVLHGSQDGPAYIDATEFRKVIQFLSEKVEKSPLPKSNKRTVTKVQILPPTDRFMRLPEVMEVTGLQKTTIYKMSNEGRFPARIKLSTRIVGWSKKAVNEWLENLTGVPA